MKLKTYIVCLGVLTVGLSCSVSSNDTVTNQENSNQEKKEEMKKEILIIKGTADYQLEVGFGTIFNLSVNKVVEGAINDTTLSLVIVESAFTDRLTQSSGKEWTFTFSLFQEDFEENRMSESGIVDGNRTAWKLMNIE